MLKGHMLILQGWTSVTTNGGRLYTSTASSKTSSITYSAHAKAWDSLNPWAPVTKFKYGWIYF